MKDLRILDRLLKLITPDSYKTFQEPQKANQEIPKQEEQAKQIEWVMPVIKIDKPGRYLLEYTRTTYHAVTYEYAEPGYFTEYRITEVCEYAFKAEASRAVWVKQGEIHGVYLGPLDEESK